MGRYTDIVLGSTSSQSDSVGAGRYSSPRLPTPSATDFGRLPNAAQAQASGESGGLNTQAEALRNALEEAGVIASATDDGGFWDGALDIAKGGARGMFNVVAGTLDALDTAKSGVVSGLTELVDMIDPEDDASWGEFVQQTRDNMGVGDWISDWDTHWLVKGGIGFVGDVLLDPLTYASLGATAVAAPIYRPALVLGREGAERVGRELAEEGVERVGREVAEEGAERAARDVTDDIAQRTLSDGSVIGEEELIERGLEAEGRYRRDVGFRLPARPCRNRPRSCRNRPRSCRYRPGSWPG